jgi:DNA-binding MarR family transcriptional regulator
MSQQRRFAELLSQIARDITLRQAADVCCGDLTLEQFQTLQALSASEPLSMGSLSAQLRVDVSTMSRNVSVMERNGYLTRARSDDDGRFVHVRLSPKGRRALETLCCDEREVLGDVYARIPPAERSRVMRALEVLEPCLSSAGAGDACCPPRAPRKSTP